MKNGKYAVINSHMRGASHIAKGMDCEDYSDVYLDDKIAIAVTDGNEVALRSLFRLKDGHLF